MSNSNRSGRPVDPNSALSRATAVYDRLVAANPDVKSKAITDALVAELGVKNGTAQVYLHKVRSALGLTTERPRVAKTEAVAAPATEAVADKGTSDASTETVAEAEGLAQAA